MKHALVAPPAPVSARVVFGSRWPLAESYVRRLADEGVVRGLIGPHERDRLWQRHMFNCAVLAALIPSNEVMVADLGSGAGLPGIVIALLRPDVSVDLIEPLERRAVFLQETVDLLGLDHLRVVRARAESLAGQRNYDVVTARAVAPLTRLVGWALPLVRPGGELLALKGAGAADELLAAEPMLTQWRVKRAEVLTMDAADGAVARVVRVVAGSPPAARRVRGAVGSRA